MTDQELVEFLKWCLPGMQLRWSGFRKVRRTIRKRLNRRMRELGLPGLAAYRQKLQDDPEEWSFLDGICRIPISRFYRDRSVYDLLAGRILPDCATAARQIGPCRIRVLSAGCASGEEPHTLSLIWHLRVADNFPGCTIEILALDIDEPMLARAASACYPAGSLKDMPADLVARGFRKDGDGFCLHRRFRRCVDLQKGDLRKSVPAGPFDIVFCRNTAFTYFDRETQMSVLSRLDDALRPGGYLVIGAHETLPDGAPGFRQLPHGVPIYRKDPAKPPTRKVPAPAGASLLIDGSFGEGGGQILRSALGLAAITGRAVRIDNIRARRKRPGLAAQHLTSVRAMAEICDASVEGDDLRSMSVDFRPGAPVRAGRYRFDVTSAGQGRSAGSAALVLQAVLIPLALAGGGSQVTAAGGTHVPWSPSFDYLDDVWLPMLERIGITARMELRDWGWFPAGGGRIVCSVRGPARPLHPLRLLDPGALRRVTGRAVAAGLPEHISNRMAERATAMLDDAGITSSIEATQVDARSAGAGLFLTAHYEHLRGGFSALGQRGKPAETVAEEAVANLLAHWKSGSAVETHLSDQLVLPLSLADGASEFSAERISAHLEAHAWLVERFGLASVTIIEDEDGTGRVRIVPRG